LTITICDTSDKLFSAFPQYFSRRNVYTGKDETEDVRISNGEYAVKLIKKAEEQGMSHINFIKTELAAAIARGARQCVLIASGPPLQEVFCTSTDHTLRVFVVDEGASSNPSATFVPTYFTAETLAAALEKSDFDKLKASLFVWLGGAGYRAAEGVMASLAFIASLPEGTGVVLDYVAERTSLSSLSATTLDALASRISLSGGKVKHLIQPQAVAAMLYGLGFRQVVDLAKQEVLLSDGHLVSAVI
jgi:O-methyltransferase involved in polyketide biosynthesis